MVLGGVGWDKKELLESNLHVYGREGDLKEGSNKIKKSLEEYNELF